MEYFIKPHVYSGDLSGPTIVLVALTHGNEPVGLSIFEKLMKEVMEKIGIIQL